MKLATSVSFYYVCGNHTVHSCGFVQMHGHFPPLFNSVSYRIHIK